jgi:hypothetical protein
MRRTARAMFGTAAMLAGVLGGAVLIAVLFPHQEVRPALIHIAALDTLPQGTPIRVTSTDLAGLDLKAARSRHISFGRPRGTVKDLPIFLVRDGDTVRGFIGIDPRNGCDIELLPARTLPWGAFPTMLHDVCHGSIYDFTGKKIGGPSPWALDEVLITVRNGRVYAASGFVIPGAANTVFYPN